MQGVFGSISDSVFCGKSVLHRFVCGWRTKMITSRSTKLVIRENDLQIVVLCDLNTVALTSVITA